jgi:sugar phosphate permease
MSAPAFDATRKKTDFFYGWWIVVISTLALLISNGLAIGGLPVFYKPIQEDLLRLGAVTPQNKDAVIGLAAGLTFLLSGIFSLIVGLLVRRFRLKTLMSAGCVVLGGGLLLYSTANAPTIVYLSHCLLGLSLGLIGVMMQTVIISNWFRRLRGTAMGIVLTGTSFGGALIPVLATPLIQNYGWRAAIQILSLIVWLVLLPAVLLIVKDCAADIGLNFDGDLPAEEKEGYKPETENRKPEIAGGLALGEAVRTPVFWALAFCAALIFYPIFTVSQQFNLYLQNTIGVSPETASAAQSMLFVTSVGGKFLFGWLCDKFTTKTVILFCCGLMFAATLMLLGFLTAKTIFVFLVPFGLGYGGTFVLIQVLAVESFGLKDIGRILGVVTLVETLGGFAGSVITGRLASISGGDYTLAFYGVTIAAGLAFLMTLIIKIFKPKIATA